LRWGSKKQRPKYELIEVPHMGQEYGNDGRRGKKGDGKDS
jgi:hypothetical protein